MECSIIHDFKDGQRYAIGSKRGKPFPKTFLEERLRKRKPWWKVLPVDEIGTQSSFENFKSMNKYRGMLV